MNLQKRPGTCWCIKPPLESEYVYTWDEAGSLSVNLLKKVKCTNLVSHPFAPLRTTLKFILWHAPWLAKLKDIKWIFNKVIKTLERRKGTCIHTATTLYNQRSSFSDNGNVAASVMRVSPY